MLKVHLKSLFSQSVFYGLGLILNRSIGILLLPLYTAFFTSNQLGAYALIYSLWLFINVIYLLGMETSFLKFFIDAKSDEDKSEIYCNTLLTVSVTSIFFSIIIFLSAESIASLINFENFSEGIYLVKLLAIVLFCDALYRFPLLLLRAEQKAKIYFRLNIITIILNLFFNFYFIAVLDKGVESILISYLISSFFTFMISLYVTRNFLKPSVSIKVIKKLLQFGNKFIYIGLLIILIDQSDKFFLKYFFDESTTGIYSAISRLAAAMGILMATFKFTWIPYFLNLEKTEENKNAIADIFTYFIFSGMFLCLIFSFFIPVIVSFKFGNFSFINENYWIGLPVLHILIYAFFFSGIFTFLNVAPFFSDKTYLLLIITFIGFILNISLNYFLIPLFDMSGAAYSLLFTYLIMSVLILILSQKIYPIKYKYSKILILLASGSLFLFINPLIIITPMAKTALNIVFIVVYLAISRYSANIKLNQVKSILKRST